MSLFAQIAEHQIYETGIFDCLQGFVYIDKRRIFIHKEIVWKKIYIEPLGCTCIHACYMKMFTMTLAIVINSRKCKWAIHLNLSDLNPSKFESNWICLNPSNIKPIQIHICIHLNLYESIQHWIHSDLHPFEFVWIRPNLRSFLGSFPAVDHRAELAVVKPRIEENDQSDSKSF